MKITLRNKKVGVLWCIWVLGDQGGDVLGGSGCRCSGGIRVQVLRGDQGAGVIDPNVWHFSDPIGFLAYASTECH